ncbi:heparan-alpha-glucosaminide N-acetyltransferase-like, partial [Phalaenopsis equestris]|uniref:heparan-alpha-glucosaminide N-acetyltransferase-like n=1 Tax=Phalaenopsis equestris TaxID=78828 RepID=UPI0009E39BDF
SAPASSSSGGVASAEEVEILPDHHHSPPPAPVISVSHSAKPSGPNQRLASLDVFRGLTVALMILVDDAGGAFPAINHAPWFGVTVADFVMPFFLFGVGVSIALACRKATNKFAATRKIIMRTIKLFWLGVLLQGGYFHGRNHLTYGVDIDHIRWLGVLQLVVEFSEYDIYVPGTMIKARAIKDFLADFSVKANHTYVSGTMIKAQAIRDFLADFSVKANQAKELTLATKPGSCTSTELRVRREQELD